MLLFFLVPATSPSFSRNQATEVMWLFTLPEGEQKAKWLWLTPFCSTINGSYLSNILSSHPSQSKFRVTQPETNRNNPKHSVRNLNKTWDKTFQGACCSQKPAISPAKVWASSALCCPHSLRQMWLAQVQKASSSLAFTLSIQQL